jgi:hypothetical protein
MIMSAEHRGRRSLNVVVSPDWSLLWPAWLPRPLLG